MTNGRRGGVTAGRRLPEGRAAPGRRSDPYGVRTATLVAPRETPLASRSLTKIRFAAGSNATGPFADTKIAYVAVAPAATLLVALPAAGLEQVPVDGFV